MKDKTNILEIEKQSFEFDSPIKTKYIDKWASIVFNLVLLENGDVYTIIKKGTLNKFQMGHKIDENCSFLDLVADPNNITPIFKTDNNLHYFVRYTDDIDNKKIDINLYHKSMPLLEELKNNTLVPYYIKKSYSKKFDVYSLKYLATKIQYDKKSKTTQLSNVSDDYVLFDYKNKTIQFEIENDIVKLTLDGYEEDTDVLRTLKFNGHFGYKQITYKKNSNYALIKSNGKGAIVLFLQKDETDKSKYDFVKEFEFYNDYNNNKKNFTKGLEYLKEKEIDFNSCGYDLFTNKYLPNRIDYEESHSFGIINNRRVYDDVLQFSYTDKKEKIIIPKNQYTIETDIKPIKL